MKQETYEITADSLQAAREQARNRLAQGFYILSERVLSDGEPVTLKETADKSETAFAAAQARVPAGAHILTKNEVQAPEILTLRFSAESEESARKQADSKTDKTSVLQTVSLAVPGKRGFLGIGRTLNQYDVHILKKAVVEVTYKTDAKIMITTGELRIDTYRIQIILDQIEMEMQSSGDEQHHKLSLDENLSTHSVTILWSFGQITRNGPRGHFDKAIAERLLNSHLGSIGLRVSGLSHTSDYGFPAYKWDVEIANKADPVSPATAGGEDLRRHDNEGHAAAIILELAAAIDAINQNEGYAKARLMQIVQKEMLCHKCGNDFVVAKGIRATPGSGLTNLVCPHCGNHIASLKSS